MAGFPLIIIIGASALHEQHESSFACRFLGRISYPLYITHYPFVYMYFAYVHGADAASPMGQLALGVTVWAGCIAMAYVYTRCYDEPVRRWLTRRIWGAKDKDGQRTKGLSHRSRRATPPHPIRRAGELSMEAPPRRVFAVPVYRAAPKRSLSRRSTSSAVGLTAITVPSLSTSTVSPPERAKRCFSQTPWRSSRSTNCAHG